MRRTGYKMESLARAGGLRPQVSDFLILQHKLRARTPLENFHCALTH